MSHSNSRTSQKFNTDTIRVKSFAYKFSFIVYEENDSILVTHDPSKKMEDQYNYIAIQSPLKKVVVRAVVPAMNHKFSEVYVKRQMGKSIFKMPEVYELANIILVLACEPLNKSVFRLFTKLTDCFIKSYKARPKGEIIADLYPEMHDWCEK